MDGEILILKKEDLLKILEVNNEKLKAYFRAMPTAAPAGEKKETPQVRRLGARQIKEMLGIGDSTFEKIQGTLPLHRTRTGRLFGYQHDIIVHLFREHPPYFDYARFWEYVDKENLVKFLSGSPR
jgi:hypothetical protein